MKLMKKIHKKESGQAMVLALVLMLVGSLTIAPFLGYMGTGLKTEHLYEGKMYKLYAADAGTEYAMNQIVKGSLASLPVNGWWWYHLHSNGLQVNAYVQKRSVLEGMVGEGEYNPNKVYDNWISFSVLQVIQNLGEGWVEYTCRVSFDYTGPGWRRLESVGAFLCPFPGDEDLIEGPYDWEGTETGQITFAGLEGPPETKIVSGGFSFNWRWVSNLPEFKKGDQQSGTFAFKFKVYDPDWSHALYLVWSTFQSQDAWYDTGESSVYTWLIEATTDSTGWWWPWWGETDLTEVTVRSAAVGGTGGVTILTWEINPPHEMDFPW